MQYLLLLTYRPEDNTQRGPELDAEMKRWGEVTDEMRLGVVCLPYGWGHDAPGARLRVAAGRPGVNTNILTDGAVLDPVSGNATLNGIPVTVSRPD